MPDPPTTIGVAGLTAMALAATVLAVVRLRLPRGPHLLRTIQYAMLGTCVLGSAVLFVYRAVFITAGWRPFGAHVDGLLLISALYGATVLFVQRASIRGLAVFALPILTILLAWGICASVWTYDPFPIGSLWETVHQLSVYLGSLFCLIAAAAGVMYLYAQRRLRRHLNPAPAESMASLEAIERLNVRTAAIGFGLLTLAMLTGLIIATARPSTNLGPGWWHSPKVLLAVLAWLLFAVVMNVRHASAFRGARAAWLSILGVALLVGTFAAIGARTPAPADPAPGAGPSAGHPAPPGAGATESAR